MITRDLIGTKLLIKQKQKSSFNLDTVLLANFVDVNKSAKLIVDIGTGNGALPLYMSTKSSAKIIGVEIEPEVASIALDNVKLNNLEHQIQIINEDINLVNTIKGADICISNPPFFKVDYSRLSNNNNRNIQRHELTLTLESLFGNAKRILKETGIFYLIHRPTRLSEIIEVAIINKFAVKEIKFIYPYINKEANHVLIKCVKNGKIGLKVLPPLILYDEVNQISNDLQQIYSIKD